MLATTGSPELHGRQWVCVLTSVVAATIALAMPCGADEFDRIVGPPLFAIPQAKPDRGTKQLSLRTIESLPEVVRGERSAFIVATTDQGNLAKLLVSPGLRKMAVPGKEPASILVLNLDRYEAIDAGDRVSRKARGRDVVLFAGFEIDLDSGQVVPPGFGGDIAFVNDGADGPRLTAIGSNMLYPMEKPLTLPASSPGRPSPGPAVLASDFNGRFYLSANGQTSGALELTVSAEGIVAGRFRSDRNGAIYPVEGKVAGDLSRRIEFTIQFPRSHQTFDGLLWTEEKNVFAGTAQILEHPYSFVAIREGSSLLPEMIDAPRPGQAASPTGTGTRVVTLEVKPDRYGLDGASRSAEELSADLTASASSRRASSVLLRVPATVSYGRVDQAIRLIRQAGIADIRLGQLEPQ